MGLKCSHDAFHGAYSAFNRFRQCVAKAVGGSFPPHYVYGSNGEFIETENGLLKREAGLDEEMVYFPDEWPDGHEAGLKLFLLHSDCDGQFTPDECVKVADALEHVLPAIESLNWPAARHILARGGYVEVTREFIAGCRAAAAAGEPLEFC